MRPDFRFRRQGYTNHLHPGILRQLHKIVYNYHPNNITDLKKYINSIISHINYEDDLTKQLIISKISKDYLIDEQILIGELNINPKKEIVKKEEKKEIIPKVSKYHKAVSKILYMMMLDNKYITIYKNKLGYFKERIERVAASEIVYYNGEHGNINIADYYLYNR